MIEFIDGYKIDHRRQYPEGTEYVYSNFTPRSSRVDGVDEVVFFGLQAFLKLILGGPHVKDFFENPSVRIKEYKEMIDGYLGPNNVDMNHLHDLAHLGYIPLEFKALPEGSLVPLGVPMFTVENTHPDFAWLVNYIETILSAEVWMPCTSATTAYYIKKDLLEWAEKTGGSTEFVDFQGHDFSFRGLPGLNAAAASGAGHLLSFRGSDTIPSIRWIESLYPGENGFIAGSVPATEHSVMCAGGQEDERETYERLLDLYPSGIVSVVSDTWDLWKVLRETLPSLRDKIMARDGKLVVRPDSGDPADILCGNSLEGIRLDAVKGVVEILWEGFGGTVNEKGYKELDSHIGVIYGDSINREKANEICRRLEEKGFASTNVVFGIGSFNYQYVTRDTFGFAMKATSVVIDGEQRDIFKKPVTDNGGKFSAKGRLAVVRNEDSGKLELLQGVDDPIVEDELVTVWKDGKFVKPHSFAEVRENLWTN